MHWVYNFNWRAKINDWFNFINADLAVFVTKGLLNDYSKRFDLKNKKTLVLPDGVDLKIFDIDISTKEACRKLNLPLDKKILGYMGRFKTAGMEKGIDDILESLKLLNDKNIIFMAVGGSEEEIAHYQEKAEKLNINEQVILLGHCEQNKVAIYQKACDVLLMPFPYNQHYAYFMSPLKMFEYMASKRPIIASNLPSVREVLNETNAILIEPDNPESLTQGIKKSLENKELSDKISKQAYFDAQKYSWEQRAKNIVDFISK